MEKKAGIDSLKFIFGVSMPVLIIGLVTFLMLISSEMMLNILPLFTMSIGGTPLILGLIAGMSTFILNILYAIWGWMDDKYLRQKSIIICGCLISNVSKLFLGFSPSWEYDLGLKTTEYVGNCIRTSSCDDICSCNSFDNAKALRYNRVFESLGLVMGSFFPFIFVLMSFSYSQIIFFSVIPG